MTTPRDEILLNDLLDGRLDGAATAAARRRLQQDADFREAWAEMRRVRALLRADDGLRAPRDFVDRVRARIEPPVEAPRARRRSRTWPRLAPLAAAAVLLVALGISRDDTGKTTTLDGKRLARPASPAPAVGGAGGLLAAKDKALPPRASLVLHAESLEEGAQRIDAALASGEERRAKAAPALAEPPPAEGPVLLGTLVRRVRPEQLQTLIELADSATLGREVFEFDPGERIEVVIRVLGEAASGSSARARSGR